MSDKTLKDQVVDYYAEKSLSPGTAARLRALALEPTEQPTGRRGFNRLTLLVAAAVVLLAFAAGFVVARNWSVAGEIPVVADVSSVPRLVAVNIRADWCLRTPEVTPIFETLTERYGDEPILFLTMNVTEDADRRQARYMATAMGIEQVFDEPFESGMIKLIDRESATVVAMLTGEEDVPEMENLLAQVIPTDLHGS
jgi:hypothetical protein